MASIFGFIELSSLYVEAMIAMSIVFLAREFLSENEQTLSKKYLSLLAFTFGLLHGFGFSSLLVSIGLPQGEIPLALFSFNIGIEIGQLIFVGVAYIFLKLIKKYFAVYEDFILKISVYAVGVTASLLFLQRVLLPFKLFEGVV